MIAVDPIPFDVPPPAADGYAFCQTEDGERIGWHVHHGARVAWTRPDWAAGRVLIHIMGGTACEAGFEEEGTAFLIDPLDLVGLGFDIAQIGEDA